MSNISIIIFVLTVWIGMEHENNVYTNFYSGLDNNLFKSLKARLRFIELNFNIKITECYQNFGIKLFFDKAR